MSAASWEIAEFVLGTLPVEKHHELSRQQDHDGDFAARVREMQELIAQGIAAPLADADELFTKIMSDVLSAFSERAWLKDQPGFEIKELWNPQSLMVKCFAGTLIPAHQHNYTELMLVLDGKIRFGESVLSTGACETMSPGTHHEDGEALEDCLLLIQYT